MVGLREMLCGPVLYQVVVLKFRFLSEFHLLWQEIAARNFAHTWGVAAVYTPQMLVPGRDYSALSVALMAVGTLLQYSSLFPKSVFRMMDQS